ncbi:Rho termination factor N-terminal domain-containing protein, partial [Marinobacter sp.]|uniref:Rho termination factor N-terminal domain-containing protein n=1 Tax=Marinobacter sp. TaxID=50741 RepID=UPI0035688E57
MILLARRTVVPTLLASANYSGFHNTGLLHLASTCFSFIFVQYVQGHPCHSNTRLFPFLKIQQTMNLTELKQKSVPELLEIAQEMGLDNLARSRKQDVIFTILKKHAKSGEDIYGDGVLEILQDGFGF